MFFGEPLQKNFPNVTPSQNPAEEVLFLPRTPQKMWQCYFSPPEKRFYRPLLKNCIQNQYTNDVTLPSALQKFILGIFTLQKLTFWTTIPLRKTSFLVLTPSESVMRHVGYCVALHV